MVSSRLYINKGNLEFEDITELSRVLNTRWGTGAVMADVNQDGWMDIYIVYLEAAGEGQHVIY